MASLAEVIPQFLNPDNNVRQQAEQLFAQHRANPPVFVPQLLELARTLPEPQMRQMCAVLLRRNLDGEMWPAVGAQGQQTVKSGLLEAVVAEAHESVRKAVADAITKLASIAAASGGWAELLPFVFKLCVEEDARNKKLGLDILSSLSLEVGAEAITPLLEHLQPVFSQALCPPHPVPVRVACLKTVASIVPHVVEKEHRAQQQALQGLLPACFSVLHETLGTGDMAHAHQCLSSFVDIASTDAGFLRPHVDTLLSAAFGVAGASVDENVRHLGLELMVSFAEGKPAVARKVANFVATLMPVMFSMIETFEDDDEWNGNLGDEEDKDEVDDNVRFGEEAMSRIFVAIGGNRSVPAALPLISAKIESGNWKQRYAGLRALDILVGSTDKALKEHLPNLVAGAVRLLGDSKAQVAWAAANVVASLCLCFGPQVQQEYHAIIVPAFLAMLEPSCHGRLRTIAAGCMVDFLTECEEDEVEMVTTYSDGMVTSLTGLLTTGTVPQQRAAIAALSSLAHTLDKHFVKYYDHLMPGLIGILTSEAQGSSGRDGAALAGRAMECVAYIADAVGEERFGRDAPAVMELLMALHARFSQGDDENFKYLLQACSRIAVCMGAAFSPYLERLMPSIFAYAELDPKLDMVSADGDDGDDGESAIMMVKGMGKMKVSINIKALEDKSLGFSLISALAENLKEHFLPFVKRSIELLVPCCTYKLSGDVREAAIEAVPHVLTCVGQAASKGMVAADMLKEMLVFAWPQLLQASLIEPDAENQHAILSAISDCIDACGSGCMDAAMQEQLCEVLRPLVEDHVKGNAQEDEDEDEEDEEEESMMIKIVEVVSSGMKVCGGQMVPHVQAKLLPHFGQLLGANRSSDDKIAALNCLCEVVDHGGEASWPLVPNIAAACLQFCNDSDAGVRRSANYGLAVCAEKGGSAFDGVVEASLARLHPTIVAADAKSDDNKFATDNAVDAIGRICKFRSSLVNTAEILPVWISWLPLRDDDDCARHCHSFLADLIEAKHPAVQQQLPAIMAALPAILTPDCKLATPEVQQRLRQGLAQGYGQTV